MVLGFGLFVSTSSPLLGTSSPVASSIINEEAHSTTTEVVIERPVLHPELYKICACESGGGKNGAPKQFNADGTVLRGKVDPLDTGMCQISKRYWLDMSDKLGYDIETETGNILMANYIYSKHGKNPWKASFACWGK